MLFFQRIDTGLTLDPSTGAVRSPPPYTWHGTSNGVVDVSLPPLDTARRTLLSVNNDNDDDNVVVDDDNDDDDDDDDDSVVIIDDSLFAPPPKKPRRTYQRSHK